MYIIFLPNIYYVVITIYRNISCISRPATFRPIFYPRHFPPGEKRDISLECFFVDWIFMKQTLKYQGLNSRLSFGAQCRRAKCLGFILHMLSLLEIISDALHELFLKISVPLEYVPSWENDLFLWDFRLAGRKGTDMKNFYFHFQI